MEASTSSLTDRTPTGTQTQVITVDGLPVQVSETYFDICIMYSFPDDRNLSSNTSPEREKVTVQVPLKIRKIEPFRELD